MGFETTALLLTWVAILLLGLVVAGLVRQVHALTGHPERPGPPAGAPLGAPAGTLAGAPAPGIGRLDPVLGNPTLLLFLSADCATCAAVLAEARALRKRSPIAVRAIFAEQVTDAPSTPEVPVYLGERRLFAAYGVVATPYAVLVAPTGRIRAAEPIGSASSLRDLLVTGMADATGTGVSDPVAATWPAAGSRRRP